MFDRSPRRGLLIPWTFPWTRTCSKKQSKDTKQLARPCFFENSFMKSSLRKPQTKGRKHHEQLCKYQFAKLLLAAAREQTLGLSFQPRILS